jgi:hypothetical protein
MTNNLSVVSRRPCFLRDASLARGSGIRCERQPDQECRNGDEGVVERHEGGRRCSCAAGQIGRLHPEFGHRGRARRGSQAVAASADSCSLRRVAESAQTREPGAEREMPAPTQEQVSWNHVLGSASLPTAIIPRRLAEHNRPTDRRRCRRGLRMESQFDGQLGYRIPRRFQQCGGGGRECRCAR